jgi:hypothetical protein
MTLRLVGAGLPRTGTHSLKVALEQLLGGPCYHMVELLTDPEKAPTWRQAVHGTMPNWDDVFAGYVAAVDWPASAFWREIAAAYPDAPVVLSVRDDADTWWRSADKTVWAALRSMQDNTDPWSLMAIDLMRARFTDNWSDEATGKAVYERHNDEVRAAIPADRLVEWKASQGWEPLCAALGLPLPDEPFPLTNTTEEFLARLP